ncbi:hypothetical protein C0J52_23631 [Blattella germanica]|nr:hypothetical protein C0J52_23631 [Blattella germanica]
MSSVIPKVDDDDISSVTKLKDSSTFSLWDFEVKILFKAKQLLPIVDGSSLFAECGTDEQQKWTTRDAIAQHIILRTVDKTIKVHLMTCNNSKAMYDILVRIYKKDSDQEKCLVLQEFYNY